MERSTATSLPGDLNGMTMVARTASTAHLSDEMRVAINKRMRQAPILTFTMSEADVCSDDKPREPWQKQRQLMSGKVLNADSMVHNVLRKIIWPHYLVYSTGEQPPACEDLSFPLFVSGYLAILDATKLTQKLIMIKHLKELIAGAELGGWDRL